MPVYFGSPTGRAGCNSVAFAHNGVTILNIQTAPCERGGFDPAPLFTYSRIREHGRGLSNGSKEKNW
jgi:hypothetical protein